MTGASASHDILSTCLTALLLTDIAFIYAIYHFWGFWKGEGKARRSRKSRKDELGGNDDDYDDALVVPRVEGGLSAKRRDPNAGRRKEVGEGMQWSLWDERMNP